MICKLWILTERLMRERFRDQLQAQHLCNWFQNSLSIVNLLDNIDSIDWSSWANHEAFGWECLLAIPAQIVVFTLLFYIVRISEGPELTRTGQILNRILLLNILISLCDMLDIDQDPVQHRFIVTWREQLGMKIDAARVQVLNTFILAHLTSGIEAIKKPKVLIDRSVDIMTLDKESSDEDNSFLNGFERK